VSGVHSRYLLISNTTMSFLRHIYPDCSMSFHLKRVVRFIDIHHLSTLSSISCTYTPCSICAQMYMYDEIFIHIHPKIDIYPFRSRWNSINTSLAEHGISILFKPGGMPGTLFFDMCISLSSLMQWLKYR